MMREKKIKGKKRHIPVDAQGLLMCAIIHPAHSDASGHLFRSDPATDSGTSGHLGSSTVG